MLNQFVLNNGLEIPNIGFGTWKLGECEETINVIKTVLSPSLGNFLYLDTAAAYLNEKSIGEGIKACGISRKNLFVSGKLWNTKREYAKAIKAFKSSLKKIQLDYLDLYLIHWPVSELDSIYWKDNNLDTWKAMEELYQLGLTKSIGVCNYMPHHLEYLLEKAEVKPMINQIEYHPGYMQVKAVDYCKANNILVEAWSPLGNGKILNNIILKEIALKYNRSEAQICIRWCLQNGILPITKTANFNHMKENKNVFDFSITEDDMQRINDIAPMGESGIKPDQINAF